MGLLKIKDHPDLVKDEKTKAILNTNEDALEAYKKRREQQRSVQNMCEEIDEIKNDINDIKVLLKQFINTRTED
jgi:septal ring factor EnvC (AmiA/AmiB activator)